MSLLVGSGGVERVHVGPVELGGLVHELLLHQLDCSKVCSEGWDDFYFSTFDFLFRP